MLYMAEAYQQVTGKVGVALLTAGPGFANGLSAIASATASQTPVVVMTGDAPLAMDGRGAFQEMDQQTPAGALAKASYRLERSQDAADMVQHAMAVASGGTPGPVHISLPDDVLRHETERAVGEAPLPRHREAAPASASSLAPSSALLDKIRAAKRPIFIAGPAFARPAWKGLLRTAGKANNIPFLALESPRGLRAPRIGILAQALAQADLVILLGMAPNFMLGFGEGPTFSDTAEFICFSDDIAANDQASRRLGADRVTSVGLSGAVALMQLGDPETLDALRPNAAIAGWREQIEEAIAWRPPEWADIRTETAPFHAASVGHEIKTFIDRNDQLSLIIDGGEIGQWAQAILDAHYSIINGPSGAIGGSIPYAIAAKAARPDQPSIAILGDGTAGFYFMEFETALREELPFVAIIGNDAKWNAEHQIQLRDYGENRTFGCEMHPTRYDEVAKAMGGYGENVTNIRDIVPAIERAIASGKPACLNVEIQSIPAPVIRKV